MGGRGEGSFWPATNLPPSIAFLLSLAIPDTSDCELYSIVSGT